MTRPSRRGSCSRQVLVALSALLMPIFSFGACSLTALEGFSGGEATDREGGLDSRSEASVTLDAHVGETGSDARPPSPCGAAAHALCADFDEGPLEKGWDDSIVNAPLQVSFSDVRSTSGAHSMRVTIPARASATTLLQGALTRDFPGAWHKFHVELDLFVERTVRQAGESTPAFILAVLRTADAQTGTVVWADPIGSTLSIEGPPSQYFTAPGTPEDEWVHVVLDFDLQAGAYQYDLGGKKGSIPVGPFPGPVTSMFLRLGITSFRGPAPVYTVHYDNVVVDLE